MNKAGPIIIIEDDHDDRNMLKEILDELNYPNELIFFEHGVDAFDYLNSYRKKPFLVLSDINMPMMNGFELRDKIYADDELRINCIPYLFLTTSISPAIIIEAFQKSVQGFFVKPNTYGELQALIKKIMEYWMSSKSPYTYLNMTAGSD